MAFVVNRGRPVNQAQPFQFEVKGLTILIK